MVPVPPEGAGRGEFAQFMPNHIFTDIDRDVPATVMNGYGVSDHIGKYGRTAGPGFNNLFISLFVHLFNLFHQAGLNIWALFQ